MQCKIMAVTPELAKQCLSRSKGNRPIRKSRLEKYCRARRNGQWLLTHQGFAFDTTGTFIDGHHRCQMIIETGMATDFLVVKEVHPDAAKYIDAGLPRNARDAIAMAGLGDYGYDLITVCKCICDVPVRIHALDLNTDEILLRLDTHAEAINFACKAFKSSPAGISRATRTLIARAWPYIDSERLLEFAHILRTGEPKTMPDDQAAITFRNFLLASTRNAGEHCELVRYRKGQTALNAFAKRQPLSKIYGTEKDLYPLNCDEATEVSP